MNKQKKEGNFDPFLQRAVEYWLDSANELGYQPIFCEWLISQGYILKYSIRDTSFEQGKDVVAVNPKGIAFAYQLKGGDIGMKRWRNEVKPEIEVLIDIPIKHPEISKSKPHVSYLVTNGNIADSVREEITDYNIGKWKKTPLRIITRGDLLNGFQEMAKGILPADPVSYKRLLDLMLSEGDSLPDLKKASHFLTGILKIDQTSIKKEQRKRDIAAAMLYATMIAGPYRKVENHVSVVQIMTLLLSSIFYLVEKYELEDNYWIGSYEVIWSDIQLTAGLLENEVNINGFESALRSPFDPDILGFRKHCVMSIIYPFKLSQFISGNQDWTSITDPEIAAKYVGAISIWGEASFLPVICVSLLLKRVQDGESQAIDLLQGMVINILRYNGRGSTTSFGLPPPYYDISYVANILFNVSGQDFEDKSKLHSYYLKIAIEMLVRLNDRSFISEIWSELSFIRYLEFVPDSVEDFLLWRTKKGVNKSEIIPKQKSWNTFITEANTVADAPIPKILKRFPMFMPFFLSVFPHRANASIIGYIDNLISNIDTLTIE